MPDHAPVDGRRPELAGAFAGTRVPFALRRSQREALQALEMAWAAGRRRACVVLPPGAGETIVGLEAGRRLGRPVIALGPNTAIQEQWIAAWRTFQPVTVDAGADRRLSCGVTALTYQSVATFDDDADVDEDGRQWAGGSDGPLLERLHPNGRALVERMRTAGTALRLSWT